MYGKPDVCDKDECKDQWFCTEPKCGPKDCNKDGCKQKWFCTEPICGPKDCEKDGCKQKWFCKEETCLTDADCQKKACKQKAADLSVCKNKADCVKEECKSQWFCNLPDPSYKSNYTFNPNTVCTQEMVKKCMSVILKTLKFVQRRVRKIKNVHILFTVTVQILITKVTVISRRIVRKK